MTDSALQRVWDSREAISRRCDFDSHKLIRFYQSRQKTEDRTKKSTVPAGARERAQRSRDFARSAHEINVAIRHTL